MGVHKLHSANENVDVNVDYCSRQIGNDVCRRQIEMAKSPLPARLSSSRGPAAFRAPCRGDGEENHPAYGADVSSVSEYALSNEMIENRAREMDRRKKDRG